MAYKAARMEKVYSPILATVFVLVIFALPCSAFSAQSVYTIQLGSYQSKQGANRHYDWVLKKLNPQDRSSLRIEKVGKYYALRLGYFENSEAEAKRSFRKVKAVNPGAIMLTTNANNRKIVSKGASTTVAGVLVSPVETVVTPVAARVAESEATRSLSEPEPPAEGRETAANIAPAVILKPQDVRAQAPVAVREPQPLIPDGLLIGFTTIIWLFMLEHYLLALARLGRFESLKLLFAESSAAKWLTERKDVERPEMGEELQVGFETGPNTPVAYFVGNDSVLADEWHAELRDEVIKNEVIKNEAEEIYLAIDRNGPADVLNSVWLAEYGDFDPDEGRICADEGVLTAAEEVSEITPELPESENLQTVVPRTSPRKCHTGGGAANKTNSSEKAERENRVARAVLAVSFFVEE